LPIPITFRQEYDRANEFYVYYWFLMNKKACLYINTSHRNLIYVNAIVTHLLCPIIRLEIKEMNRFFVLFFIFTHALSECTFYVIVFLDRLRIFFSFFL
jgi:hypothetical protein